MPNIVLQRIGHVPEDTVKSINAVVEECYGRLEPHGVELLDLLIFENSEQMDSFYRREKQASQVSSETLSEQFFATHDAWRGTPRIGICIERMRHLPQLVQMAVLRHEVGHSILHGSIEHYVFSLTPPLLEASRRFGLTRDYAFSILYIVSIAVKDFEVTRFLVDKKYVEDQLAYALYVLAASEDDLKALKIAQNNPAALTLYVTSRLKDSAGAMAAGEALGQPLTETFRKEFSQSPDFVVGRFLYLVEAFPRHMKGDTLQNVNAAVRLLVEEFLEPVFTGFSAQS